jgi:hypothetical protein
MPFADKRQINFNKDNVLHIMDARSSMANYYTITLQTYLDDVDSSIDNELEAIAELEMQEKESAADLMTAILERMNPNNNMH